MRKVDKKIKCIYEAGLENMIVLVTTRVNNKNYVMTSSTTAEVSHEPPILSVSICPERYTHDRILERGAFAINLLSLKQKTLARACGSCSGKKGDKFEKYNIDYRLSKGELPFIQGCFANIGCKLVAAHRHGDHTIFVGEMIEADIYGERSQRHLLLSDMKRKFPASVYTFASKIPIFHWIRRIVKNKTLGLS